MRVLGIETTCDETAIGIVVDGVDILANCIASQATLHAKYGGVFPEIASREHVDAILPTLSSAISIASLPAESLDLIAVAHGPGLIGSLLMGVTAAKALSLSWNKPLIGVNHVEAHLYSAMMGAHSSLKFPALGVVLSGGHTLLMRVEGVNEYRIIGKTVDDAMGETFDKVALLLDLPYPGGPHVEMLAREGDPQRYRFQAGKIKSYPLYFSFSGLKSQILRKVKGTHQTDRHAPSVVNAKDKQDIAASFQQVIFSDLLHKVMKAANTFDCQAVYLGGGVTSNMTLKALFEKELHPLPLYWPPPALSLDNGAMIAGLGYHLYRQKPDLCRSIEPFAQFRPAKHL